MPEKVALVGFADLTLHHLKDLPDDFEVWTAGRGWDNPKIADYIDRCIEIHLWSYLEYLGREGGNNGISHWDWLNNKKHPFPVYTSEAQAIDNNQVYPFDAIVQKFFGNVKRGDKVMRVFTCTADYLMALALFEGAKEIRIIGIEMSWNTEYLYQKPGMAFWLGMANAMGVKVWIPEESQLFRPKTYHEGGQMITDEKKDLYLRTWSEMRDQAINDYINKMSLFDASEKFKDRMSAEEIGQLGREAFDARDHMNVLFGFAQAAEIFKGLTIGRHTVERYKEAWSQLRDMKVGAYNHKMGRYEAAKEYDASDENVVKWGSEAFQARDEMNVAIGLAQGAQVFEDAFDIEDLDITPDAGIIEQNGIVALKKTPKQRNR